VRDVVAARPEQFLAVGREFIAALKDLPEAGGTWPKVHIAHDSPAAAAVLRGIIRRGDVLLVKGSRGIGMERVIDSLSGA